MSPQGSRPAPVREGRGPGTALAALAGAQFVVILSTSIVNVALPSIRDGIGLTDDGASWVVNSYGLAFGALLLAGGRLADLLGRRRVLLGGLALFAASSAAAGLAPSGAALITARTVQGLAAAAVAPAALALVTDVFPPGPGRGRAFGVWGAVSGAGGAAGVLLGGALTQGLGWPWTFHATAIGAALVLAATVALLPAVPAKAVPAKAVPAPGAPAPGTEPPGRGRGGFDVLGAGTAALGLTALVWALTAARRAGWTDPLVLAALAAAVLLLGLFLLAERRHPSPLLPPRLFRTGQVAAANLLMVLLGSVWIALFYLLPLYQQQVLGDGPLAAGLGQLPLAAANMLGAALVPRAARRFGAAPVLAAALLTEAAGLLWLSRIDADGGYLTDVFGPSIAVGLGLGAAFAQLTGIAVAGVPPTDSGLAGGLVNTTRQVGGAVGLAVLGTLAAAVTAGQEGRLPRPEALTAGYRVAFLGGALVLAVAAGLALVLLRRPARTPAPPAPVPPAPAAAAPLPDPR
ncbi:MFS transporter [Kitasatospora sp. NPDC058406]|uniref:MFS transporter n=1 Tax=Kitasatospora sp. NPDC058406 TaxID=3346483 RepID=UPI003657A67B